jgi:hypothetical protein
MATTAAVTYSYAFDPSATLAANWIKNEQHVVTAVNGQAWHVVVPDAAPFFVDDLVVSFKGNDGAIKVLTEGVDFHLGYYFKSASLGCRKPIYGAICLLDLNLSGVIMLQYRTLGGEWVVLASAIYEALANVMRNPRTCYWEQISGLPYAFPPIQHPVDISALKGMEELCDALTGISTAIAEAAKTPPNITPQLFQTKSQVGLGAVDNFPTAALADVVNGTSNRMFTTPAGVRAAILDAMVSFFQTYEAPLYMAAMPSTGTWKAGKYVVCSTPTYVVETGVPTTSKWYGVKYLVRGWSRLTNGGGNQAGVDWMEDRVIIML